MKTLYLLVYRFHDFWCWPFIYFLTAITVSVLAL